MAFEQLVRGGGILTQGFGQTAWACANRSEWNCPGRARCPYGFHAGIDIASSRGTPVLAVGYGVCVTPPRPSGGCGGLGPYAVCIRSGPVDLWYGHLLSRAVYRGDQVGPGQVLGYMDSLGCSNGDHLHFEVEPASDSMVNGCNALDPWPYTTRWPGQPPAGSGDGNGTQPGPTQQQLNVGAAVGLIGGGVALTLYALRRGR